MMMMIIIILLLLTQKDRCMDFTLMKSKWKPK